MSKLKDCLLNGLQKLAQQHTAETLGDRSQYLGVSEVGSCPRKVILSKINPVEHDLVTLLRFRRGHMAEDIVADALTAAGFANFERQVEIRDGNTMCHIDFVFTSQSAKTKSILEVKSPEKTPQTPHSSWETQLYLQMGLLARKYPDYVIKGAILSIPLGDEVELFNGYTPENGIFNGLRDRAEGIWLDYQRAVNGEEVELATEVTPLCGYCPHLSTCPRFDADEAEELAGTVDELVALQAQYKALAQQIDFCKGGLLAIVSQRGPIKTSNRYLREAQRSQKVFVMDRLAEFLRPYGRSVEEFQESRPYSFLEIKKAA
ncbi:hypothetical protein ACHHRT_12740 [Desulfurivibrio sp. D14AmB]|uniref:hypothetical protein n=1 Tax=Desulfurivibrio sp. D14AmB TaxID=3374370 RepID=UPI00376EE1A7